MIASGEPALVIEFVDDTRLHRELDRPSALPIYRNGPAGTFVVFPDGLRVSLPTDQIVIADDTSGRARVGFGGMGFGGVGADGRLVFPRLRELHPEEALSPARSHLMLLEPQWVLTVFEHGRCVWPHP